MKTVAKNCITGDKALIIIELNLEKTANKGFNAFISSLNLPFICSIKEFKGFKKLDIDLPMFLIPYLKVSDF
ncbi:Uncharacterised protein [Clostridioides difficile]|nr:Uncharacterised protein [Clostridioides difficile]